MITNLNKVHKKGIRTISDLIILMNLKGTKDQNLTQVSTQEELQIDACRKSIDRLELKGFVKTQRKRGSRGYVRICNITAKGKALLK